MPRKTSAEGKRVPEVRLAHDGEGTWFFEFSEEMGDVQSMIYDMAESIPDSPSKAERRLCSTIERHPYAFDAYDRLAYILYYGREQRVETIELLEKGLGKLKDITPTDFVLGKSNLPWGILENRPFFRMYRMFGVVLMESGEIAKAKEVFQAMVGMNPDDNQGIRELLCSCYFQLRDNQSVIELCRKYRDDGMAAITFGRVLALFKVGRVEEARKSLREAMRYGANIAREIMADRHKKLKDRFFSYELGSRREAELYWDKFGSYWDAAAVKFIREEAHKGRSVDK